MLYFQYLCNSIEESCMKQKYTFYVLYFIKIPNKCSRRYQYLTRLVMF